METLKMLEDLCQAYGVAGEESEAIACASKCCKDLGKLTVTTHNSLVCEVNAPEKGKPHLVLNAHIDEIGLIITSIDSKGFLLVNKCGGIDRRLVMASPVIIHAHNEKIYGVIGSIPPHLQNDEPKTLTFNQMYIDAGLSFEEAEKKDLIGCRVSFEGPFTQLRGGLVSSKALDDRCGCVAVIKAAELIKEKNPKIGVSILLSSMEETGGLGAKTATYSLNPTHSIVVDVSFANSPSLEKFHLGDLKKGPMIGIGSMLDREMSKALQETAKKENIPYQMEVIGGTTGTDADVISATHEGVRSVTVSIPQRYMHMPIEVVSMEDIENTAKLIAAYALSI